LAQRKTYKSVFLLQIALWALFCFANYAILTDYVFYGFDDGAYSHAFLIPFVCLYLLWDAASNRRIEVRHNTKYLLTAICLAALMAMSYIAQIAPLYRFIFPATLVAFTAALFRPSIPALLPAVMLYFIAPIWGILTSPLQWISIKAVSFIMSLTTVPSFVENTKVHIPSGTFEIAGGCSGLRYLIVSCAIGVIYCHLNLRTLRSCFWFMGTAIAGALLVNWLRIFSLILIGHYSEMQSPIVGDHNMFGWYLYAPFLVLLFLIGSFLERREHAAAPNLKNHKPDEESRPWNAVFDTRKTMITAFAILLVSTTSAGFLSSADSEPAHPSTATHAPKFSPTIINPSYVHYEPVTLAGIDTTEVRYAFDGLSDSNKATFYLNSFIPKSLRTVRRLPDNKRQIYITRDPDGNLGLVLYSFELESLRTASKRKYQIYRLARALTFDRSSSISWIYLSCNSLSHCERIADEIKTRDD
jgi:exosortase